MMRISSVGNVLSTRRITAIAREPSGAIAHGPRSRSRVTRTTRPFDCACQRSLPLRKKNCSTLPNVGPGERSAPIAAVTVAVGVIAGVAVASARTAVAVGETLVGVGSCSSL